jgi:hypothetical protein
VPADQLGYTVVYVRKSLRQVVARLGANHAAFHERQRIATFLSNNPVTRDRGARIDAKDHDGS